MDGKLVNKNSVLSAMILQANKKRQSSKGCSESVQQSFLKCFNNRNALHSIQGIFTVHTYIHDIID